MKFINEKITTIMDQLQDLSFTLTQDEVVEMDKEDFKDVFFIFTGPIEVKDGSRGIVVRGPRYDMFVIWSGK